MYTGSLFQFLQANDNEKEPQTIEEMASNDYYFYLITSYQDLTENSVPMRGRSLLLTITNKTCSSSIRLIFRRIIITPDELKIIINKTLDSSFKGGLMITLSQVLYRNQVSYKEFTYKVCKVNFYSNLSKSFYLCTHELFFKEYYTMVPVAIFFPLNSYLTEIVSRKLEEFEAAGLINYWASAHTDTKYLNFNTEKTEPKKINMNHLSGTVQLFVCGIIVSSLVFIAELILFLMRNINSLRRLQNFISSDFK